jgi:hypothetical protein
VKKEIFWVEMGSEQGLNQNLLPRRQLLARAVFPTVQATRYFLLLTSIFSLPCRNLPLPHSPKIEVVFAYREVSFFLTLTNYI